MDHPNRLTQQYGEGVKLPAPRNVRGSPGYDQRWHVERPALKAGLRAGRSQEDGGPTPTRRQRR
jgi:hypothetical protein